MPASWGAIVVFFLAGAAHRHQQRAFGAGKLLQATGDLPAIHPGQADVQQHHIGRLGPGLGQGCFPVASQLDIMSGHLQQQGQRF